MALAAGALLQRRYAHVRNLTTTMKSFLVFSSGMGAGAIFADKAGIKFDVRMPSDRQQENYSDRAAQVERKERTEKERLWSQLSTTDKALTYAKDNKFSVVVGSWFASMAGSWLYIQAQPLSFSQKLVQARVWAQGLTVACLIGVAAVTQIPSKGDKLIASGHSADDHSWERSTYLI